MNTNLKRSWRLGLAISSSMLFLGCLDKSSGTGVAPAAQEVISERSAAAVLQAEASENDSAPLHAIIAPANLSPGVAEVVKLIQSGVGEEVLVAYLEKSGHIFSPTVDEIVYLKDLGLSEPVLATLVRESTSAEIAKSPVENAQPGSQLPAPAPINPVPAPSLAEPAAPSYSVAAAPTYDEAATTPQPQQVNINYFEQTLSPYGSWIVVGDYGRCWQPTVVSLNPNWRPYGDRGRWIYTSSGWYWQSDYSWGWAPFHYGRWHCDDRAGWVWVPGSTWGPAWVSWRYTDSYCGWAPLPPTACYDGFGFRYHNSHVGFSFDFGLRDNCYTFVPTSRFCDRYPSHYYVARAHSSDIYRQSIVANNYHRGHDNAVINEGIGRNRVAETTHTAIRTVPLRDLPTTSNPVGRAERLEGNGLTVFRPNAAAQNTLAQRQMGGSRTTSPAQTTQNSSLTLAQGSSPEDRILLNHPTAGQPVAPSVTQNQQLASTTTPLRSTGQTFLRTPQPSGTRGSQSTAQTQQQPATTANGGNSGATSGSRSTTANQELSSRRSGSTSLRQLPAQSAAQERSRNFGGSAGNVPVPNSPSARIGSGSSGAAVLPTQPTQRESRSTTIVRSQPTVPQIQREQPAVRETRRQESPRDDGGSQSSLRSMAYSPAPSAPVQRQQTFSAPSGSSSDQRARTYSAPSAPGSSPPAAAAPLREVDRSNRNNRKGS